MSEPERAAKKKEFKVPHTFVILFTIIIVMAVMSYIIPGGSYERYRDEATGRTLVNPESYHNVERTPASFFDVFMAIPIGFGQAQEVIFAIFIVGGAFVMVSKTGAIDAGVGKLAKYVAGNEKIIIPVFLLIFSLGGATFGMAEETIVFVPVGVMLARAMGYDRTVGCAMITLGAACGFNAGVMNPFTVGVAQQICELPLFSGIEIRIVLMIVLLIVTIIYIMRYAAKVKKDPQKGIVYDLEVEEKHEILDLSTLPEMTNKHKLIYVVLVLGFVAIIYGVFKLSWYIPQLAATFLVMAVISSFIAGIGPSQMARNFIEGAKDITFGALVCGVGRGILVIMTTGGIMDSCVYYLASAIQAFPRNLTTVGMYIVQVIINTFIPSGSGQAAATMPIMRPLADLLGITRQTAVFAFQMGDGFTNSIIPTSSVTMAYLSVAKIPYEKWFKFIGPLMLIWLGIGVITMIIVNAMNVGPF